MKRFYSFALIMLTLLSSMFFFACGDKYKDLSMGFYSSDGTPLENIELVIDSEDASKAIKKIGVKFSGIDSDEIGSVLIYSSSNESINISNYIYDDDFVWVELAAITPTAASKIFVKHLDSNQVESIDLVINKKSNNIQIENSNYIVSIPASEENEHIIKTEEVLKLLPFGSSDKILYQLDATKSSYSNVTTLEGKFNETDETSYVNGFKTVPESTGYAIVYPVTYLKDYEVKVYNNLPIKVFFCKTLNADLVEFEVDSKYIDADTTEIYNPIKLVYNDKQTNVVTVALKYSADVDPSMYMVDFSTSNKSSISAYDIGDDKIVVQAKTETIDVETVNINWRPYGYAGDIDVVTKKLYVKGEARADFISVEKADVVIDDLSQTVDIYDYYASGNALGAKFNFKPKTYVNVPVYEDLAQFRISVDPKILNATGTSDTGTGYNVIYTDEKFETVASFNTAWRINKNVLDISLFGSPLKFYYDADKAMMISEPFTSRSDLFIKYKKNDKTDGSNNALKIDINTIYSGNYAYLADTESTKATLKFTERYGVVDLNVDAGYFENSLGISKDFDVTKLENVYLNINDNSVGDIGNKVYKYYIKLDKIFGVNGEITDAVEFDVIINGSLQNSLKVYQGCLNVGGFSSATTYLKYTYTSIITDGAIVLVFDTKTTVGKYTLTISQPDTGFNYSLNCWVYEDISSDDLTGVLQIGEKAFNNVEKYEKVSYTYVDDVLWELDSKNLYYYYEKTDSYLTAYGTIYKDDIDYFIKDYEYGLYRADYIVASKQNLNFDIELANDSQENSHIIQGFSIDCSINDTTANLVDYFTYSQYNNTNNFTFSALKGTYIKGDDKVVTITLKIKVQKYSSIVEPGKIETLTKSTPIKIFIYEEIGYDNLSITPSTTKYYGDYLGANYLEHSLLTLDVSLDDTTLWNYIQTSSQSDILSLTGFQRVVWLVDNENNIQAVQQLDKSLTVEFVAGKSDAACSRTFTGIVHQFKSRFMLTVKVDLSRSIITEKVSIKEVKVNNNATDLRVDKLNNNYYINLKVNDELTFNAESFSSLGEVTHPDYYMVVVNKTGNVDKTNVHVENPNELKLKVNNVVPGLKIIVFAKDALALDLSTITAGFDNIEDFLVDFKNNNNVYLHQKAYMVINLELSDGKSMETPYLISSADDFWKMATDHQNMIYTPAIDGAPFYRLTKNIDLTNTVMNPTVINGFKGTLFTTYYSYDTGSPVAVEPFYTIYGITLNNNFTNLFTDLQGTIENIKFVSRNDYNLNVKKDTRLGLIDVNNGTLTNVSCEISGTSEINGKYAVYYGGLVGENKGTIEFVDSGEQTIGVSGIITLKGSAKVYFGGLVGKNVGEIVGYELEDGTMTGVEFTIELSDAGLMSNLNVTSELDNADSAIGGVIGLNTYEGSSIGTLTNAEVGGSIISTTTNNIGGVVGTNIQEPTTIVVDRGNDIINGINNYEPDAQINRVKSYVRIQGKNNLGGIVGSDTNGVYANIKYQILADADTFITGESNVGGIAGSSSYGKFIFCSVMSYKWEYNAISDSTLKAGWEEDTVKADIYANNNVGGIVGLAISYTTTEEPFNTGNIDVTNRVIVYNSSVNSFIKSDNKIGGLLCSKDNDDVGIAYNAYFMGKAMGNVAYINPMCLFSENSGYVYDRVYTVNYKNETDRYIIYGTNKRLDFDLDSNPGLPNWYYDSTLNGGYIYVTNSKDEPIFEVAPTDILVEVQTQLDTDKDGYYDNGVNNYYVNSNTLWLPYYRFIGTDENVITVETLAELNNNYNKVTNLLSFLKFTITPTGGARLKVESSDKNIIVVGSNGDLFIKGVGACQLIFSSRINSKVEFKLNVIVTYPTGDSYSLIEADSKLAVGNNVSISKGTSKLYYIESVGEVAGGYLYETNSNINYDIEVNYSSDDLNLFKYKKYTYNASTWNTDKNLFYIYDAGSYAKVNAASAKVNEAISGKYYIEKYNGIISISNIESNQTISGTDVTDNYFVPYSIPFSISVLQKVETTFKFTVRPSLILIDKDGNEHVKANVYTSKRFDLKTSSGPSGVSLSYDSAILYPNDITIITAYIKTDKELTNVEVGNIATNSLIEIANELGVNVVNNSLISLNVYKNFGFDANTGIQTVQFEVVISENVCKLAKTEEKRYAKITIQVASGVSSQVEYLILPQRINSIEIKNYYKDYEEFTNYNPATWNVDREKLYYIEDNKYLSASGEVYNNLKTYYTLNYVLDNVLQQDRPGLIIIDMAPVNGYFDYLEIVDANGSEEILFTQLDDKDGYTLSSVDKPAKYGKGIKLTKDYAKYNNRLYVATAIDQSYSSSTHTIVIYAFLNDGTCLNPSGTQYDINVEMLPQITAEYRIPSGKIGKVASTQKGYNANIDLDLAIGTNASLYIETRESDGVIDFTLEGEAAELYTFEHDNGSFYKIKYVGDGNNHSSYLNKNMKLTLKTQSYLSNGDKAEAEVSFNIDLVEFVVHDISISNSVDSNNITQIYGNINQELELELYFKETDISYFDVNKQYWNTKYRFNPEIAASVNTSIGYINNILRELNTNPNNYISLVYEIKEEYAGRYNELSLPSEPLTSVEEDELDLINGTKNYTIRDGNKIKVIHEDYNKYFNVYLQVKFDIVKDVNKFKIQTASLNPTINKKYALNFVAATSPYEPKLIKNKEDFLSMTTGYYILGVDLELENYTPIEIVEPTSESKAQLIELDGNGRTITITSFNTAELTDAEMQVGLFKKIPNGTTIKNLNVRYLSKNISGNFSFGVINKKSNDFDVTEYFDLCSNQNINYTKSTFGGLAAANFGVVTNCNVFGEIAIRATTIEEKKYASQTSGGNYEIDFFVGGLVGVNESTGYITNSTNALRIFAQANIGGLVYENKGKIVSSAVDTYTDYSDITIKEYQPLLYNYNNALEKTIAVKMGGLAVINSSKISMSYVNFLTTELSNGGLIGNMSAKDVSAGFVYTNSGNISDAYVVVDLAGNNQNEFYGFVYQNTSAATIEYSFTYVNRGEWGNNSYMFTANSAPGINNCLEIVNYDDSYTVNSSNGLETVKLEDKSNRGVYESINLAFGDNKTAVWQMVSGQMPKLVSTLEKVSYEDNRDCNRITVGDVAYEYYYGLKNVVVMEEYKFNEKGEYVKTTTETTDHSSYGTKENPILILNRIESNNISCWENYFTQENYRKYFRLVSDIDLSVLSRNPKSSTLTFSGNIQGNNMDITGYMLYTTDALEGIGLFKEIVSANDIAIESSVRNLNLTATSVWAAKTKTVGLLAGLVENYNLYNIHANAPKIVMVGGNAVGGVAGVVRGNFDIQRLSGNIGVNSTTVSSGYKYSVYMSKNNAVNESSNLDNVYYAGGVIAILDGYDNSTINLNERILTNKYFSVKDISVKNNIVALADTVGAAFGFVGERVSVKNIDVNLTEARISGRQYSAGAIGENRGVVNNVNVVLPNNAYTDSTYVVAGVVGLNAGGLVQNTKASFTCERNDREITIGGIIGRNIYGVVTDSISDAKIIGYYTGGIVGSNYKYQTLQKVSSSSGAFTEDCRKNAKLIPTSQVIYKANESATPVVNFKNTGLTINSLSYFVQNTNKFHTVSQNEGTFSKAVVYNRVLGLCIGLTDDATYVINSYGVEGGDEKLLMFNAQSYNVSPQIGVVTIKVGEKKDIDQEWPCSNVLKISDLKLTDKEGNEITGTYMTYITGAVISEYDAWERNRYAADMLIITDQDVESPMWNISSNYYISIEKIEDNFVTDAATSISTRTIKYFYVIRNLVGTNNMTFDFSSLLETFESGVTYKVDNVNSTDTSKTMSAVSNKYSLKLEGTAKVATGSPHTLIYEYEFTIV